MRNFNKIIIIIYVLMAIYILFGKFYLEANFNDFFLIVYQPFFFLLLVMICFYLNYNSKDRNKHKTDIIETIIIVMMMYAIIYFGSGLFLTYVKSPYSHSIIGILKNCWIYIVIIFLEEYVRYTCIKYSGRKKIYFAVIAMLFFLFEININSLFTNFQDGETIFKYLSSIVLPCLCHSFLCTYLVQISGYKASLVYRVPLMVMKLLLPIYPNLDWFFTSFFEIVLVLVIYISIQSFIEKKILKVVKKNARNSNSIKDFIWIGVLIVIICFMAGIFKYQPVAIMSNSMYKLIKRGDMVVTEKLSKAQLKKIKLYDIIEYRIDTSVVVHRVVAIDIDKNKNLVFTTKGDNNNGIDKKKVTEDQIVGIVKFKVPKLGYPSVWMSEFFKNNRNTPDVEMGKE